MKIATLMILYTKRIESVSITEHPFERHLEKIHVTWTQFGKKRDKIETLHEDDEELAYSAWRRRQSYQETASESLATTSA
ncbi:hypothetical protein Tco_0232224 [Tanacetum coccineum]